MNDKFDQLAKSVAGSVTRRQALRRFGLGLAAIALAGFGLPSKAANTNRSCMPSGDPCGGGGQGGCGSCCSKSHFCFVNPDVGRQCFCN